MQGTTENKTIRRDQLANAVERGLDATPWQA
jgi:hypothetical protein